MSGLKMHFVITPNISHANAFYYVYSQLHHVFFPLMSLNQAKTISLYT